MTNRSFTSLRLADPGRRAADGTALKCFTCAFWRVNWCAQGRPTASHLICDDYARDLARFPLPWLHAAM